MKIVLRTKAIEIQANEFCRVTEFPLKDEAINFGIVHLDGRYPSKRRVSNLISKELVYVQYGSGKLVVDSQEYELEAGDAVLIEVGEKYYWHGIMTLHISCHPAWNPEQHVGVD